MRGPAQLCMATCVNYRVFGWWFLGPIVELVGVVWMVTLPNVSALIMDIFFWISMYDDDDVEV